MVGSTESLGKLLGGQTTGHGTQKLDSMHILQLPLTGDTGLGCLLNPLWLVVGLPQGSGKLHLHLNLLLPPKSHRPYALEAPEATFATLTTTTSTTANGLYPLRMVGILGITRSNRCFVVYRFLGSATNKILTSVCMVANLRQ